METSEKIVSVVIPVAKHGNSEYSYVAEAVLTKDGYKITEEHAKAIVGIIRGRPY
jgi:hypothetical protein